jgi:hypothetical protein
MRAKSRRTGRAQVNALRLIRYLERAALSGDVPEERIARAMRLLDEVLDRQQAAQNTRRRDDSLQQRKAARATS